jgi:hypothetical protein
MSTKVEAAIAKREAARAKRLSPKKAAPKVAKAPEGEKAPE